jgi:hypothetical protein
VSYILTPQPQRGGSKPGRRTLLAALAVLILAAAGGAYRMQDHASDLPDPPAAATEQISWTRVGPWPVPVSATHGPHLVASGLAAGFSHDELGAAMAAWNISLRLTSDAAPLVYTTTAHQQTFGDVDTTVAQIQAQPTGGSSPATELYYRIVSGDPDGDLVLVAVAEKTPETAVEGGYGTAMRTLRWQDGDWRLQVPMSPGQFTRSLEGYHFLGTPDV